MNFPYDCHSVINRLDTLKHTKITHCSTEILVSPWDLDGQWKRSGGSAARGTLASWCTSPANENWKLILIRMNLSCNWKLKWENWNSIMMMHFTYNWCLKIEQRSWWYTWPVTLKRGSACCPGDRPGPEQRVIATTFLGENFLRWEDWARQCLMHLHPQQKSEQHLFAIFHDKEHTL